MVKFANKKDATSLASRKTIDGLNNDSIDLGYCTKFYVEEHRTPYVASLAYKCRCLKRRNLIIKTKIQKGTVKILKNFDGGTIQWVSINHINDITSIFPDVDFLIFSF